MSPWPDVSPVVRPENTRQVLVLEVGGITSTKNEAWGWLCTPIESVEIKSQPYCSSGPSEK